jgi:TatD DNase family protein
VRHLPPIDMHAHIEADISAADLLELRSLIFAATRSLDEAEQALRRSDPWTVWGVGCHPGLVGVQKAFGSVQFAALISRTPYVSEVGLDGSSRVPLDTQRATFEAILTALQSDQRITSIHSYGATEVVLDCLTARPIQGAVLHWWLGDEGQTKRAIELGCYFSINVSSARRVETLRAIPIERVLTETDHPFGDRSSGAKRRPGNVESVELMLAQYYDINREALRLQVWRNLRDLVSRTRTAALLSRPVRVTLAAV